MTPFFIVGSPRSGTTILRNYIKSRTDLICPEETFYYRWTFPFGSNEYFNKLNSPLQRKHREIDEIDEKVIEMTSSAAAGEDLDNGTYIQRKHKTY